VNNADRNAIPSEEIRAELERALASPLFSSADRASRFLRFIVERHIEGQANSLKEYSIALDVFDRDHSYDPKVDAIVRVEAGRLRNRLGELSGCLGATDWLDGEFSAGDLLMVAVLLRLKGSGMLDEYPNLSAYVARGESRPAYKRAFDAQLAVFTSVTTT